MKASEVRETPSEELVTKISGIQRELVEIKLKGSVVGDDNQMGRINALRRDVARMKTIIRERELAK